MEKNKVSRKALKSLLNDSLREAIGRLELPQPTKKLDRIISKSSKRLAHEFADLLKKQSKKVKAAKAGEGVEAILEDKKSKKARQKKSEA